MRWNPNGEDKVARNNESTYPHKELLKSSTTYKNFYEKQIKRS